jgi:hypothetical protein
MSLITHSRITLSASDETLRCGQSHHFLPLPRGLGLPAFRIAIAIACFCGRPCRISVLMFWLIVFGDDPDFSGIALTSLSDVTGSKAPDLPDIPTKD